MTRLERIRGCLGVVAWCATAAVVSSCSSIYTLPDAPPRDEWVDLDAEREEDPQEAVRRFLDAKRIAISVYSAMKSRDWDTVLDNVSQETLAFLEDASNGAGAEAALESGQLTVAGSTVAFDPANDFFIANLLRIEDTFPGQTENETPRRKELFVIDDQGRARKVLFIYEADAWRFHSPFLNKELLEAP